MMNVFKICKKINLVCLLAFVLLLGSFQNSFAQKLEDDSKSPQAKTPAQTATQNLSTASLVANAVASSGVSSSSSVISDVASLALNVATSSKNK